MNPIPRRDPLAAAFYIVGIIIGLMWFAHMVWSSAHTIAQEAREASDAAKRRAAELDGLAKPGKLIYRASSSAQAANITLTNKEQFARYMCVKGVIASKKTGVKTESVEVCSGDLKPFTTVTLQAPYNPGAVHDLCSKTVFKPYIGETEEFDWDLCTFDIEDTTVK